MVNMVQGVTERKLSRIFKAPSFRILKRLARFFKDLALSKIFKDLGKILKVLTKTFEKLLQDLKDPQRSCEDSHQVTTLVYTGSLQYT